MTLSDRTRAHLEHAAGPALYGLLVTFLLGSIVYLGVLDPQSPGERADATRAVILVLVVIFILLLALAVYRPGISSALLVITAAPFPVIAVHIAAVILVGTPVNSFIHDLALLIGSATAGALWLGAPIVLRPFARPERANLRVFGDQLLRQQELRARLDCLAREGVDPSDPALCVAEQLLAFLEADLKSEAAPKWAYATGYIDNWNRIHRIEEAMLAIESTERLATAITQDRWRLDGSNLSTAPALRAGLDAAEQAMSLGDLERARQLVRRVRRAFNEYQDGVRDNLVRLRNEMLRTIALAALTVFVLFALAALGGATSSAVLSGGAIFWVGAGVGLVRRLHDQSRSRLAPEDYGLGFAQLVNAPVLSGLAALGGVFLVGMLTTIGPAAPLGQQPGAFRGLASIFDIGAYPFALVVAAAFGLLPGLLLERLGRLAAEYGAEISPQRESGRTRSDSSTDV